MSYRVQWTNRFKKDYKLCESRSLDMTLIDKVIALLSATEQLKLCTCQTDGKILFKKEKNRQDIDLTGPWTGSCKGKLTWKTRKLLRFRK